MKQSRSGFLTVVFGLLLPLSHAAGQPNALPVSDALPFQLEFVEKNFAKPLPSIQSNVSAALPDGRLLITGGRTAGLHTFFVPGHYPSGVDSNFPAAGQNTQIWIVDPETGSFTAFDVSQLQPTLADPLAATNQQYWYDRNNDQLYIVGGYGLDSATGRRITFPVMLRINGVGGLAQEITKPMPDPAIVASHIERLTDTRFAVTGGGLKKLGGMFFLIFGNQFDGEYSAFGGDFSQSYTEEVRIFTLLPGTLSIDTYGALTSADATHPFHRRDVTVVPSIDPASGRHRIAALGGVFPPGVLGSYGAPIYISILGGAPVVGVDKSVQQLFSQYKCPVITVHSSVAAATYHTFFGGISNHYYHFTPPQQTVYDQVSNGGRNDGLPFIADVTTLVAKADGSYEQWILTTGTPANRLLGSSTDFIPDPALFQSGKASEEGVVLLDQLHPGDRVRAGWIYGGIEADYPLPQIPNQGTHATNSLFEVYLSLTSVPAFPATEARPAIPNSANLQRR